jgi:hypothetical protein
VPPTSPTESTLVEQTTSPTLTSQPADLDDCFGPLVPGPYVITDVPPFNIMITVPDGWEKLSVPAMIWASNNAVNLGFWTIEDVYADPCAIDLGMLDPPLGPSVDLVTAFAALPGMETTPPQDVAVDGYPAKYIELGGPTERDECVDGVAFLWNTPSGDEVPAPGAGNNPDRLWIVDVAGNRLVIGSRHSEETSPEQYAELEQILESIQIESS